MKKGSSKTGGCSNIMMTLMIICVLLSLITLGIVAYDKFIRPGNDVTCKN